ncbi:hypothetical protein [Thiothrix nivea]|uniref:hypothetical protein n=1 Tax=Thiothrix nivea TaxID=1031 RepID=UPI000594568C|nr:hypothetical protein [Thiothrix nivea]
MGIGTPLVDKTSVAIAGESFREIPYAVRFRFVAFYLGLIKLPKKFRPLWFYRGDALLFLDSTTDPINGNRIILLGEDVSMEELEKLQQGSEK